MRKSGLGLVLLALATWLGLAGMLSGCDDEPPPKCWTPSSVDVMCYKYHECKAEFIGDGEMFADDAGFEAAYGADASACQDMHAYVNDADDVEITEESLVIQDCAEGCYETSACGDLITCLAYCAGVPGDDDDDDNDDNDDDDNSCTVDDECTGWAVCRIDENDEAACLNVCADTYVEGIYGNEDCAGPIQFVTARFGDCDDVLCLDNTDCEGLGACDKNEASPKRFSCNVDGFCVRD